eukprot:1697533-Rhodomonas_salina.3
MTSASGGSAVNALNERRGATCAIPSARVPPNDSPSRIALPAFPPERSWQWCKFSASGDTAQRVPSIACYLPVLDEGSDGMHERVEVRAVVLEQLKAPQLEIPRKILKLWFRKPTDTVDAREEDKKRLVRLLRRHRLDGDCAWKDELERVSLPLLPQPRVLVHIGVLHCHHTILSLRHFDHAQWRSFPCGHCERLFLGTRKVIASIRHASRTPDAIICEAGTRIGP